MKSSKDLWIIAALLLFTVGMAYWVSLQQPICQDTTAQPGLWAIAPWFAKLAIVQMGAALLLAIFTLSRRFVSPIPYVAEQTRVRGEYLTSMAQLFQKAQASPLALELLSTQFRRDLATRLGFASTATRDELLRTLATQRPELASRAQEIFREEAEIVTKPDEARVLRLTQRMAALRKEWSVFI
jgi:hypothetical protein